MLSLNIPKQIFIEIFDEYLIITGPLGSKEKKIKKFRPFF